MRSVSVIISLAGISGLIGAAALAQPYEVAWHNVGGGGSASIGGTFTLVGTTGQSDASAAEALTGGSYSLTGGFWGVTLPLCTTFSPADFNHDCLVDNGDMGAFLPCRSRANVPLAPGCEDMDFDGDNDVDGNDFAVIQRCYRGNNQPALPGCQN
jgi:hypothetical protein